MKRIFLFLVIALSCFDTLKAAEGDTTWVQAHVDKHLTWYGDYDTTVTFPAGTATYRKVYMIFTLGKYSCPGYNPNNPGDQPGQTGWCGDWDYTVQNFLMTPAGDTLELGRLITPYARENWPRTPLTWRERYIFDVTDYYPVLQNSATIRTHYSGYSGGFTADIKFAFVEGTPERDVLGIKRLWHGNFNYGHGSVPINTALGTITETVPAGAQSAELKMNITGHGGDDNACAEFCPNRYTLELNGNTLAQQDFFRTDCDNNNLYPQSGTWVYSRANWCPGALVHTINHKLSGVSSGNYTVGMSFPAYTSTTNNPGTFAASYTIEAATIYYGGLNRALDASLEDIIAPTNAEYHFRKNPEARSPIVSVRNSGSTTISSIKFEYGVSGMTAQTYTWTGGNLASLQTTDITFPVMDDLRLSPGTYQFNVRILEVNGQTDADTFNNRQISFFTPATMLPTALLVRMTANNEGLATNPSVCETSWRIEDPLGNIVKQRSDCAPGTTCSDTVYLNFATAYKLIVNDSSYLGYYSINQGSVVGVWQGNGIAGFSSTSGSVRLYKLSPFSTTPVYGYYSGNFGRGLMMDFYTGWPTTVSGVSQTDAWLNVFPNPAKDRLSVSVDGIERIEGNITLTDMLGRDVLDFSLTSNNTEIDIRHVPNGVYQMVYHNRYDKNVHLLKRIVISR